MGLLWDGGVIVGVLWDGWGYCGVIVGWVGLLWGYYGVIMGWVGLLLDRGCYCGGIMGWVGLLWGYYWMGSDGVPDPPYSALPPPQVSPRSRRTWRWRRWGRGAERRPINAVAAVTWPCVLISSPPPTSPPPKFPHGLISLPLTEGRNFSAAEPFCGVTVPGWKHEARDTLPVRS